MSRRAIGLFVVLGLCAGLVGCDFGRKPGKGGTKADKNDKDGGTTGGETPDKPSKPVTQTVDLKVFQAKVVPDEHNDSLTADERGGKVAPERGGTLRVRLGTFPPGLNKHIVSQNTAGQSEINAYISVPMIDQDPETLEYYPLVARYWEVQDVLDLLPEGDGGDEDPATTKYIQLHGRVKSVEEGKQVTFLVGAKQVTVLKCEATFDAAAGTVTLGDKTWKTTRVAKPGDRTLQVEDISEAKEQVVPWSRLAKRSWSIGTGDAEKVKYGVRRGCRITIHLRDGVTWHDGKPYTVDDVLFTLEHIVRNENVPAANIRNYFKDLQGAKKVGARSLQFDWAKPYFKSVEISGAGIQTVPKHVYWKAEYEGDPKKFADDYTKHPANDTPIGCGPYRFVHWKKASVLELVRYDDYFANKLDWPFWKKGQPYLDKLQFVLVKNALASLKGFQKGDIDVDKGVEPATWRNDESQKADFVSRFVRLKASTPVYTYIGWNLRKEYFKNKLVRRAMTMLIPRKQIGEDIHKGLAFPVTGPFYVKSPAYDASIKAWPYDPEKGKELLKKAGVVDRDGDGWRDWRDAKGNVSTFEFEYLVHNARQYHENIAVKVQENLKKAGIKVNIRKIDWTIFAKTVQERKFDAVRYAWGAEVDPDAYQIWHSSQTKDGSNHVGYANPEVDNIIETARITLDGPTRWAMLRRMHKIVHDDQPYTFMFCFYTLAFYNKQFRGVKFFPTLGRGADYTEWWLPKRFQTLRAQFDK